MTLVVGHVTWQGRPVQPNALQALPITLTIKSGANEVDYPAQNTDASGYFTVTVAGPPDGSYDWRVKDPKYLSNSGSFTLQNGTVTSVEMGLMIAGDANNDDRISISDFGIVRGAFGTSVGDAGYDDRADFNGDQAVNVTDFTLLRANFGDFGTPPLNPGGKNTPLSSPSPDWRVP
jgi:hypothetical protein